MSSHIKSISLLGLVALALLSTTSSLFAQSSESTIPFYIGTYTNRTSQGIYRSELDTKTGKMSPATLVAKLTNPSFLCIHPNGKYLYAVTETVRGAGGEDARVVSYKIEANGQLTLINSQPAEGDIPCYVSTDTEGKLAFVANYGNGSIAMLPIGDDGSLKPAVSVVQHTGSSINEQRQKGPHAHSILLDPSGRWLCAADLGIDKVLTYKIDRQQNKIVPAPTPFLQQPAGGGPRHLDFSSDGKWALINNELTSSVTLAAWDSAQGVFTAKDLQSTLPADYKEPGNSTAEALFSPDGQFAYVSNRGHNSLAIFKVDRAAGKLISLGHESTRGKVPRNFRFDPTGKYILAENQDSDSIHSFEFNAQTGLLKYTGENIEVGMPVCIKFLVRP
jgi:6-phosphogluconolactonase